MILFYETYVVPTYVATRTLSLHRRGRRKPTTVSVAPHFYHGPGLEQGQTPGAGDEGLHARWAGGLGVRTKLSIQGYAWQKIAHTWLGLEHSFHVLWEPRVLLLPGLRLKPQ